MDTAQKTNKRSAQYNIYILDRYVISYDPKIKVNFFSCQSYYGIDFTVNNDHYQLIHNFFMGDRIVINRQDGSWSDIPFNPSTFWLLPSEIIAEEIGHSHGI